MRPGDSTPLTQFWLTLERLPGLAAVRAQWQRLLGPDSARARPFLVPGPTLASSYPRLEGSSPGPPYSVVKGGRNRFVGICDEDQVRIELTRASLIIYHLDCPRLLRGIAAALDLDPEGSPVGSVPFTFRVGAYRPAAGYSFPAYLTIPAEPTAFRQAVESVAALHDDRFLFLAPTNHFCRMDSERIIKGKGACFIPLAEALTLGRDERWVLTSFGQQAREAFRAAVLPAEKALDATAFFPTPAGATWGDLRMRFVDGHTVAVRLGGVSRTLHYTRLGMADRRNTKPTKQWELLRGFAQGDGVMNWKSPGADRRNQKRQETLAHNLKNFFRIEREPIVLTGDGKGWCTAFTVEPDA